MNYSPLLDWAERTGRLSPNARIVTAIQLMEHGKPVAAALVERPATRHEKDPAPYPWGEGPTSDAQARFKRKVEGSAPTPLRGGPPAVIVRATKVEDEYPTHLLTPMERQRIASANEAASLGVTDEYPANWLTPQERQAVAQSQGAES